MALRIRPYILAGGKSSRMGRDKAMLQLEGWTLLARTVSMLREVAALKDAAGEVIVTVCGERPALEGANRSIADHFPECGPLGGMEAALNDLNLEGNSEWAFFIPVDMPLMTAPLINVLLAEWAAAIVSDTSIRVCLADVEGRVQPLVSLVHRSLHDSIKESLGEGRYKVAPLLQGSVTWCSRLPQQRGAQASGPPQKEDALTESYIQFINVNTETDLIEAATFMKRLGSNR